MYCPQTWVALVRKRQVTIPERPLRKGKPPPNFSAFRLKCLNGIRTAPLNGIVIGPMCSRCVLDTQKLREFARSALAFSWKGLGGELLGFVDSASRSRPLCQRL